jgi:hypothetical protein
MSAASGNADRYTLTFQFQKSFDPALLASKNPDRLEEQAA